MPETNDPVTDQLLKEGLQSYLKATTALAVFEHEVQKKCEQVLAKCLAELSSAIGTEPPLASREIEQVVLHPDSGYEWRCVGAQINRKGMPVGIRYWSLNCLLTWEEEASGIYAWVGEWLGPRSFAETLGAQFQKLDSGIWREKKEVGLWVDLKQGEARAFDGVLDGLLQQWSKLWKQSGGMKKVFK